MPIFSAVVGDAFVADPLERPDRRDVQRVLECLAARAPGRARAGRRRVAPSPGARSNSVVTSSRRLPGRQPLRIERGCVQDRLPGRAWLAGAVAGDVVLGLELAARRGRRACSRHCRHTRARRRSGNRGPRAPRCADPCRAASRATRVRPPGSSSVRIASLGGPAGSVRRDGRRGEPLLGEPLRPPVERRRDPIAAALQVGVRPEDLLQLAADLPRELAARDADRPVAGQDDRLASRPLPASAASGLVQRAVAAMPPRTQSRRTIGGDPARRRGAPSCRASRSGTGRAWSGPSGGRRAAPPARPSASTRSVTPK